MTTAKPPVLLYGAVGVLLLAVALEGMYIAYLRGQVSRGGASNIQLTQDNAVQRKAEPVSVSPSVAKAAGGSGTVPSGPIPVQVPGGRVITPEQKATMLAKLGDGQMLSSSPVWFATASSDPESTAFQRALQAVFEEAGWQTIGVAPIRFQSKPGIFLFSADEEPPAYVQAAVDALDGAGLAPMIGRGYREFYKEKKQENPDWNGFELPEEQSYVIVVGRKADDAAPAGSAPVAK